jgi:hypothetical protein
LFSSLLSKLPGATQVLSNDTRGAGGGKGGQPCPCRDLNLTTPSSVEVSDILNSIPTAQLGTVVYNWQIYLFHLYNEHHLPWTCSRQHSCFIFGVLRFAPLPEVGWPYVCISRISRLIDYLFISLSNDAFKLYRLYGSITVALRSKAWNVFIRSGTRIVGSNPTRDLDVCPRFFCVCVVLCR